MEMSIRPPDFAECQQNGQDATVCDYFVSL
jgi:hypothetical protein